MCNCIAEIEKVMEDKHGRKGEVAVEVLSGKSYSDFAYEEIYRGKKRTKKTCILHSFCPFCGEKYE